MGKFKKIVVMFVLRRTLKVASRLLAKEGGKKPAIFLMRQASEFAVRALTPGGKR